VTRGAATLAGLVIGSGTSALLWLSFNPAACETSPRTSAAGLIVPSLVVGGVVGIGWVIAGLIGSEAAGTRPWRGVVLSTGLAIGHLVVILGVFTWAVLSFGGCNRPGTI
jgi:hypothetical protein